MNDKQLVSEIRTSLKIVLVLVLATLLLLPQTASAQDIRAAQSSTDIPCINSPFGSYLSVGQENEIFVSNRNALPDDPGRLTMNGFDIDPSTARFHDLSIAPDIGLQPANSSAPAAIAADLDADGWVEYIQSYTDSSGQYVLVERKNGYPDQTHVENWPNHSNRAMAVGDVEGSKEGRQDVVIASRGGDGALNVAVFGGTPTRIGAPAALWRSTINSRGNATQIRVAIGNLNNNRYADIVVSLLEPDQNTVQFIFLEYQPNYQAGSGANFAQNLQERASYRMPTNNGNGVRSLVKMVMGHLRGTPQSDIVLSYLSGGGNAISTIATRLLNVVNNNGTWQFIDPNITYFSNNKNPTRSFDIAVGDTNDDQRDELAIAFDSNPSSAHLLNIDLLNLVNLNTPTPKLNWLDHWEDSADGRDLTNYLSLAVGDLDRDYHAEVVAAFDDSADRGFQMIYLKSPNGGHLQLKDFWRFDATIDSPPSLSLGDWDNNSFHAVLQGKCAQVVDNNITTAGFIPPFWQNIQGDQYKFGSLGMSVSQEDTAERSLSYMNSSTVSSYIGQGVGVSFFDVFELNASGKVSGGKEYATSSTTTQSTVTTTVTTVGQTWYADAIVYEPSVYNCYSYSLLNGSLGVSVDTARLRFCEFQSLPGTKPPIKSSEMDIWDKLYSGRPEFSSVQRDWSSLALFRGDAASESSTLRPASLAVDDEIVNGSFINSQLAQTTIEDNPWWQVDLGSSQLIDKIRLWTPQGSLSNFYILVSDNDFRNLPGQANPQNLLNQPGVYHYTLADLGNGYVMTDTAPSEATFVTHDNQQHSISGRYVRIQRADHAQLSLAEVQVFGTNHVEPDRYPLDLRDTTPNDGLFEVNLYDPFTNTFIWKKTRGNLLWDGRKNAVLNGLSADLGNTNNEWSMSQGTVTSRLQANELTNNTTTGVEFDVEGAVGIKVLGGHSSEQTSGLSNSTVTGVSWGKDVNMGGNMQGFPRESAAEMVKCHYRFQPYYYEMTETSNLGHQHHFPVLDYLVPSQLDAYDLNRQTDLTICHNGNMPGDMLTANDIAQTLPNAPVRLNVLGNDQGNHLQITNVNRPAHGTAIFSSRTITYTPNAGFQGTDSFSYTTQNDMGETDVATVTVNVNPNVGVPQAVDDTIEVNSWRPVRGTVLGNDSDGDGDMLAAIKVSDPSHGSLQFNVDGSFVYTPSASFTITDSFTYQANDGAARSNIATVTFVNARPSAVIVGVYNDQNHNHQRGKNEAWQSGWTMQLYNASGNLVSAQNTDATGRTIFLNPGSGTYTLCEVLQNGWFNITPNVLNSTYQKPCYAITVAPGKAVWARFGNSKTALVGGTSGKAFTDILVADLIGADDVVDPWPDETLDGNNLLFLPLIQR